MVPPVQPPQRLTLAQLGSPPFHRSVTVLAVKLTPLWSRLQLRSSMQSGSTTGSGSSPHTTTVSASSPGDIGVTVGAARLRTVDVVQQIATSLDHPNGVRQSALLAENHRHSLRRYTLTLALATSPSCSPSDIACGGGCGPDSSTGCAYHHAEGVLRAVAAHIEPAAVLRAGDVVSSSVDLREDAAHVMGAILHACARDGWVGPTAVLSPTLQLQELLDLVSALCMVLQCLSRTMEVGAASAASAGRGPLSGVPSREASLPANQRSATRVTCSHSGCASGGLASLQACLGCRRAQYCGEACQSAHWKRGGHKAECRGFAAPAVRGVGVVQSGDAAGSGGLAAAAAAAAAAEPAVVGAATAAAAVAAEGTAAGGFDAAAAPPMAAVLLPIFTTYSC